LCNQKGSTGPNGEKVGFFSFPADKSLREKWLHAFRRDAGKHFSITNSTKVCSLHFKDEHLKKRFGIGRLSYVDGAVPSDTFWKRSSPRKRPPLIPRASSRDDGKTPTSSLDMSAFPSASLESADFSNSMNVFCFESDFAAEKISESGSCTAENQPSYDDLRKKLVELERLLEECNSKVEKLEAGMGEIRAHAVQLSEKYLKLKKIIFTLYIFTSKKDIAFSIVHIARIFGNKPCK